MANLFDLGEIGLEGFIFGFPSKLVDVHEVIRIDPLILYLDFHRGIENVFAERDADKELHVARKFAANLVPRQDACDVGAAAAVARNDVLREISECKYEVAGFGFIRKKCAYRGEAG